MTHLREIIVFSSYLLLCIGLGILLGYHVSEYFVESKRCHTSLDHNIRFYTFQTYDKVKMTSAFFTDADQRYVNWFPRVQLRSTKNNRVVAPNGLMIAFRNGDGKVTETVHNHGSFFSFDLPLRPGINSIILSSKNKGTEKTVQDIDSLCFQFFRSSNSVLPAIKLLICLVEAFFLILSIAVFLGKYIAKSILTGRGSK